MYVFYSFTLDLFFVVVVVVVPPSAATHCIAYRYSWHAITDQTNTHSLDNHNFARNTEKLKNKIIINNHTNRQLYISYADFAWRILSARDANIQFFVLHLVFKLNIYNNEQIYRVFCLCGIHTKHSLYVKIYIHSNLLDLEPNPSYA